MEWAEAISEAIKYMESHITEDITMYEVADHVNISPFYFQKGFSMLCGYSIAEYMRNRRMALAGEELTTSDITVIDLAMKYCYDSPDSFTKAFTRFHGYTPLTVRKNKAMIKTFAPLKLTISMKGGYIMDYRIVRKESFAVLGVSKEFGYENAKQEIPLFWQEHYSSGKGEYVCGMFGVNIDPQMGNEKFEYLIADIYNPAVDIQDGFIVKTIPAFTWAVFPCKGALQDSMKDVNTKIFSEWLPALQDYEFAAGYCIEMYDAPNKYPNGTSDENYYTEIWIPVRKK
ncbi:MAG: AraC family transcriptional regulator [Ruminococcus sp.]|jgi:AraC family transcriptional regulator|nr:AraC family transcriptional regulator [Ruminococcus sp.]